VLSLKHRKRDEQHNYYDKNDQDYNEDLPLPSL